MTGAVWIATLISIALVSAQPLLGLSLVAARPARLRRMVGPLLSFAVERFLWTHQHRGRRVSAGGIRPVAIDLVPELHRVRRARAAGWQLAWMLLGILVMAFPTLIEACAKR